jgi:RimJ/RimL family protein N-acetyltransferase
MICDFGFAIGFRRLFAITLPDNLASQKTLLNAGFELETVLRDRMSRRDGTQADAVVFAKFPQIEIKV